MLLNLTILNGDIPLKFDKYVNIYTVKIDASNSSLELEYTINDKDEIKIIGNNNLEDEINYVFIEITSHNEKNLYTLEVKKEKQIEVMKIDENPSSESKDVAFPYNSQLFLVIIFGIIAFFFVVIFHTNWKKLAKNREKR